MGHASERTRKPKQRDATRGTRRGAPDETGEHQGVLALQREIGNKGVGHAVESAAETKGVVQIGKLKIPVSGGNLAAWAAKEVPDSLDVTSHTGGHSAALKRLAEGKTKIDSLILTLPLTGKEGEQLNLGSLVIELTNGRIRYDADGGNESWSLVRFDGVHRTTTTRKVS